MNKIRSFAKKVKEFFQIISKGRSGIGNSILRYTLISGAWFATFFLAYILYILHDLPNIDNLEQTIPRQKITMLDNKGNVLAVYGDIYGNNVRYYELPRNLVNAVVATEDRKFFEHYGIDHWGIFRASIANFRAGRTVQGGSTITQQLAKIMFLSSERTFSRKIKEAILALEIEHKYSKQQILSLYLNKAYMGSGIFGVSAAAKYYFAKNVQDLNLYESAIIAGLLKSPSKFSPRNNSTLSGNRAYQILLNMYDAGFINKRQLKDADHASVILDTKLLGPVRKDYFTNWVYDQAHDYIDTEDAHNLVIQTTFDTEIQALAKADFQKHMKVLKEKHNAEQGAVVIMNYKGEILSMIGGDDFFRSSFNRVTQASRQPGSIFKTFVYAAALESGYKPEDIVVDKPIRYKGWAPQNYYKEFLGKITVEEAFRKSLNTVAVQLMAKIGPANVIEMARRLGIKSEIEPNLTSALGTSSSNLLELTAAYGTIANNGLLVQPVSIEWIRNNTNDQVLYQKPDTTQERVIKESTAENLQFLLKRAVEDGSARRAASTFKISGKTGTSQDFRDAWFIGFTDKHIIGVWVGNDNYTPTKSVSGGTIPTLIARDILRQINKHDS